MKERQLTSEFAAALDTLSRAVLSQPLDENADRRLSVRPLLLKGERRWQLERQRGNQVFHENLSREALLRLVEDEWDGRYRQALIVSGEQSAQYSLRQNGRYKLSLSAAAPRPGGLQAHDRKKEYPLPEGEAVPALVDLGVFTPDYRIVKSRFDKYRQINRFVELVEQALAGREERRLTVLDFGCGKSYLTFILYYYLRVKRGLEVEMIGYDLKADVVERCSAVAEKYGYDHLRFVCADVSRDALYDREVDMVVSLHACDTATDYALYYAIRRQARYIFSVPCCQHEINSTIRRGGELDLFLRHGIVKERMSALLTDSIRALVLEDMGYEVDLIEFTDFENSPKNIMIRAKKIKKEKKEKNGGREQAKKLAEQYGFSQTLLRLTEDGE